MADDDKPDELDCGKKRKFGKKSAGQGIGNTDAVARALTIARRVPSLQAAA